MIFTRLWNHLAKRRQKQFVLTLVLMILASVLEVVSIGSVAPFLGVIVSPEKVFQYEVLSPVFSALDITSPDQLILPATTVFVVAALLAGSVRLLLLYTITRLSHSTGADLSVEIYRRTLYQNYLTNLSRNSSEVVDGIVTKTNIVIRGILNPILILISSTILIIFIMSTLLLIDFLVALTAFLCFGSLYWAVAYLTRRRLQENSKCVAKNSNLMVKSIQEGLGGIRDILINESQELFCRIYKRADLPLRHALAENAFIGASPRYIMESIGMALIAILAYILLTDENNSDSLLPMLGVLAIGAQRLLPALQQAYSSYSSIVSAQASFVDVLDLLDQPIHQQFSRSSSVSFERDIRLENLSFCYPGEKYLTLKNINIEIKKGSCIGFVGGTGSGKSTLIDVVMSLLTPDKGSVSVDDKRIDHNNQRAWRKKIAHVPQDIYLSDSSIEENIAFGTPKEEIDFQRVREAAKLAQISDVIEELENGYKTCIGEHGAKLSGGQRQRIGIARALYKDADVLVLDEATSALDSETEKLVMQSIGTLKKEITILVIAHRLTTIEACDHIVKMDRGRIVGMGSYEDVVNEKI